MYDDPRRYAMNVVPEFFFKSVLGAFSRFVPVLEPSVMSVDRGITVCLSL